MLFTFKYVQTLNLPVERGDSRSSSDSSAGKGPPPAVPSGPQHPHPGAEPESYSYVQLTAVHDYLYPVVEAEGSLKKHSLSLPNKRKVRCRHCHVSSYAVANNCLLIATPVTFNFLLFGQGQACA